jgi:SAM-dependent methyltransferase
VTTIIDAETGETVSDIMERPDPIQLHPRGLEIIGGISYKDWHDFGQTLQRVEGAINWWLGDWYNYGEGTYGEIADQAVDELGLSYETVSQCIRVARNFSPETRVFELPWTHYREVCALEPSERIRLLAIAEKKPMTVAELRRELQAARALASRRAGAPTTPTIELADALDWLLQQPPADLVLTDPPYSTDVNDIRAFAADWLPLALRVLKPTGRAFICIGAYPEEIAAYAAVAMPTQILVWTYRNTLGPQPSHDYKLNWQAILYYRGERAGPLNCPLMVEQFTVQDINAPDGRVGDRYHKWQKPLELGQRFVNHATSPGDIVLDPFCGTGTFLLAASALGRTARGCDIDQDMLDIAISRGCSYAR